MVHLPGEEAFEGDVYHSSQLKAELFEQLMTERKRIVVVGGGKSACDTTMNFMQAGAKDHLVWLFRRPYVTRIHSLHSLRGNETLWAQCLKNGRAQRSRNTVTRSDVGVRTNR
jgi:cation diffusion facilitator CzcD-associated flavoprotein CzcO